MNRYEIGWNGPAGTFALFAQPEGSLVKYSDLQELLRGLVWAVAMGKNEQIGAMFDTPQQAHAFVAWLQQFTTDQVVTLGGGRPGDPNGSGGVADAEASVAQARLDDALAVLRMVDDNHRVNAGERRKAWHGPYVVREVRRVLEVPSGVKGGSDGR